MSEKRPPILFREMILDLHYRLRLAEDWFCSAAESLISASVLEDWQSRREVIFKIREYSQALQLINTDLCRIMEGKRAVFPADLSEWIFDLPDGERKAQIQLERLHAVAQTLEITINRELLHLEFGK